jgi:hypothetical protein
LPALDQCESRWWTIVIIEWHILSYSRVPPYGSIATHFLFKEIYMLLQFHNYWNRKRVFTTLMVLTSDIL